MSNRLIGMDELAAGIAETIALAKKKAASDMEAEAATNVRGDAAKRVKFRPQRALLEEAMAEVVEVADRAALKAAIGRFYETMPKRLLDHLKVESYCHDARIGWDTYIVTVPEWGVMGFTDGPI